MHVGQVSSAIVESGNLIGISPQNSAFGASIFEVEEKDVLFSSSFRPASKMDMFDYMY